MITNKELVSDRGKYLCVCVWRSPHRFFFFCGLGAGLGIDWVLSGNSRNYDLCNLLHSFVILETG